MGYADPWKAAATASSATDAANTLARLILATTGVGVLLGLVLVVGFSVWISGRIRRMEECLDQYRDEVARNRKPGPTRSTPESRPPP